MALPHGGFETDYGWNNQLENSAAEESLGLMHNLQHLDLVEKVASKVPLVYQE